MITEKLSSLRFVVMITVPGDVPCFRTLTWESYFRRVAYIKVVREMPVETEVEAILSGEEKFRELVKKYAREFRIGMLGKADARELMKLREEVYDL